MTSSRAPTDIDISIAGAVPPAKSEVGHLQMEPHVFSLLNFKATNHTLNPINVTQVYHHSQTEK